MRGPAKYAKTMCLRVTWGRVVPKGRWRPFSIAAARRRAPGRLLRGAAGAPAACRPVPTSRRPLQPLVAWRRRTTSCRLRPTQLEQRRRMAGRTSPGARAAAPGRSGELDGRLGKPPARLQPRRSFSARCLLAGDGMAGWTAGGKVSCAPIQSSGAVTVAPKMWSGRGDTVQD